MLIALNEKEEYKLEELDSEIKVKPLRLKYEARKKELTSRVGDSDCTDKAELFIALLYIKNIYQRELSNKIEQDSESEI